MSEHSMDYVDAVGTERLRQVAQAKTEGVTLAWVRALPYKMQSVLFSGLRGPDNGHCPQLKAVVRWLRPTTQHNADPTTDYMREEALPTWKDLHKELDFVSVHYFEHLMKALEIVAYKHPDHNERGYAWGLYKDMVELLHLHPETEEQMDARLS